LLFFSVFAATLGSAELQNGFAKPKDPQKIQISIIDQEHANSLFRKFASNPKIANKYPIDGCYARATQMGEIAEFDKVITGRIYAEGRLQAKINSAKYPFVKWPWHVAPVAYVRQPSGFDELMVFDPSLFDKPVRVAEWIMRMSEDGKDKARIDTIYYGSRFQYFNRLFEYNKIKWGPEVLKASKSTAEKYVPLQDLTSSLAPTQKAKTVEGAQ
jgi:hypothetical protein